MTTKIKQRQESEDFFEAFNKIEPFNVFATPTSMSYRCTINKEFEDVAQFESLVEALDQASEGDTFVIKLSTNGGALHACIPLIVAIQNTMAEVFVHAVSDTASAGTFLLMVADDVFINPYATLMFHQPSFGSAGSGSSVQAHVGHTMESSKSLIHDMYQDFFTDGEIDSMLAGRDFYMGKSEFDRRYERRDELRAERLSLISSDLQIDMPDATGSDGWEALKNSFKKLNEEVAADEQIAVALESKRPKKQAK